MNSANGHFGENSVRTSEGLHSLDGFYAQDIEPLGHDSGHCLAQQHTAHVHLQHFSWEDRKKTTVINLFFFFKIIIKDSMLLLDFTEK